VRPLLAWIKACSHLILIVVVRIKAPTAGIIKLRVDPFRSRETSWTPLPRARSRSTSTPPCFAHPRGIPLRLRVSRLQPRPSPGISLPTPSRCDAQTLLDRANRGRAVALISVTLYCTVSYCNERVHTRHCTVQRCHHLTERRNPSANLVALTSLGSYSTQ
jgi:hypothetical protein